MPSEKYLSPVNIRKQKFIDKATIVHNGKYSYAEIEYVDSKHKVKIICQIHGAFYQVPPSHLAGCGCPECRKINLRQKFLYTTGEFIKKAKIVHGNKYDYRLTNYTGDKNKVTIICDKHGVFSQVAGYHISGNGCQECGKDKISDGSRMLGSDFITKAIQVHGDLYDYTKVKYKNNCTKVPILCKTHGEFQQTPASHIKGNGCSICANEKSSEIKLHTTERFIEKSKEVHGDLYDYTNTVYTGDKFPVIILCKIHGEFIQKASDHLQGCGCQKCSMSKGEVAIKNVFDSLGIKYISQKRFDTCRDKNQLPFDFYLPEFNTCIEYDGEFHFSPIRKSRFIQKNVKTFVTTCTHDNIKNKFCKENGITLLRIPFIHLEYVEQIIKYHLGIE